ncbi:MAG: outer membrane protein assembly factor BamD [Rhodothermales bacterium]
MHLRAGVLVGLVVLMVGCSGSGRVRYDTPEEAYNKGVEAYERERYDLAIEYFQGVFNFGRAHEWADDAQLYLARAYRGNGDYILATNEYNRFTQIYRGDPRVAEADFERAMAYYQLSPEFSLDQSDTVEAIRQFNLFLRRYPQDPRAAEAQRYVVELRGKLAEKKYNAARQYETREQYEAAAITFMGVLEEFPETDWVDDALVSTIRVYIAYAEESIEASAIERYQKAISTYEQLLQLFPNSERLKDAEALYTQAQAGLKALQTGGTTAEGTGR